MSVRSSRCMSGEQCDPKSNPSSIPNSNLNPSPNPNPSPSPNHNPNPNLNRNPNPKPNPNQVRQLSVGKLLAQVITCIHTGDSVSGMFDVKKAGVLLA